MGIMKFLEKVFDKVEEYTPQAMEYMQKIEDQVETKNEQKRAEIERYQREYTHLQDRELVDAYNSESTPIRKNAIKTLLEGRIQKFKIEYSCYSGMSLINLLNQRTSPLEKKAIIALLEEQGYERDSDNVWRER